MYALLRLIMKTYRKYHFHVWKTLVVNFKLLPFKQAIHLPIVIYGKTQLIISNSSVKLLCSPRFGIVKFAKNHEYFYPTPAPSLLFDGKDLTKWENSKEEPAEWTVHDGVFTVKKGTGDIRTKQKFNDFQLKLYFS